MFNDKYNLTKAVLEGRKTQTRRIPKLSDIDERYLDEAFDWDLRESVIIDRYSKYHIGEVVAIAQNLRNMKYDPRATPSGNIWGLDHSPAWTNKMYVSARQCIHHIRITDIRMERLQNISDEDCIKEGISICPEYYECSCGGYRYDTAIYMPEVCPCFGTPQDAYAALIDKISGKGTWEKNPWVFVYDFTLVD